MHFSHTVILVLISLLYILQLVRVSDHLSLWKVVIEYCIVEFCVSSLKLGISQLIACYSNFSQKYFCTILMILF